MSGPGALGTGKPSEVRIAVGRWAGERSVPLLGATRFLALLKALAQTLVGLSGLESPAVNLAHPQQPFHLQIYFQQSEPEMTANTWPGDHPWP